MPSIRRGRKLAPGLFAGLAVLAICGMGWAGTEVTVDGTASGGSPFPTLGDAITFVRTDPGVNTTTKAIVVTVGSNETIAGSGSGWLWNFANGNPTGGYANLEITGSNAYTLKNTATTTTDNRLMHIQGVRAPIGAASLSISNLTYEGGSYKNAAQAGGSIRGAGLLVYEIADAAVVNIGKAGAMASPSVSFYNNVIEITATGGAQVSTNGAGLYLDGRGAGWVAGNAQGTTNLDNVAISSNRVAATGVIAVVDSSANGGGALVNHIKAFNYTNGTVSGNTAKGKNVGHVQGGGISFEYVDATSAATINLTDVNFTDNKAELDTASAGAGAFAMGGGFVVNSTNSAAVTVSVAATSPTDKVLFEDNSATIIGSLAGAAGGYGGAVGGAVAFVEPGVINGTFQGVAFKNNSAVSEMTSNGNSSALGGAFAHLSGGNGDTSFIDVAFTGNNADSDAVARGGAIYADQTGRITIGDAAATATGGFTAFSDNYATTDSTAAAASAQGGAVYVGAGTDLTVNQYSSFSNNHADASGPGTLASAQGGALYLADGTKATLGRNISFTGNFTFVNGNGPSQGGAIYVAANALAIDTATFTQNDGGDQGGAVYYAAASGSTIADSTFDRNKAAQGGAIFANGGGAFTATDTDFTGNTASANGGAAFVDTTVAGATFVINAASKAVTVSGNTAAGKANAFYFGAADDTTASTGASGLELRGSEDITFTDGFNAKLITAGTFIFAQNNTGTVTLGGKSTVDAANGSLAPGAFLGFNNGLNFFDNTYTVEAASGTGMQVTGNANANYKISSGRDSDLAMFKFDASNANNLADFKAGFGSVFEIDGSTAIFAFEKDYLVAKDVGAVHAGGSVGDYGANATMYIDNDDLWLHMSYAGNAAALAMANRNVLSAGAADAFNDAMAEWSAYGADIAANVNAAVPGFVVNMAGVGLQGIHSANQAALKFGNGKYGLAASGGYMGASAAGSTSGLASMTDDMAHYGLRFWTGYIGDFDRMDSHGNLNGYKADRHGFVSGLNYDFGAAGTVGFFGGYSHTKTKARGMSAEVDSDAGHFGLIGRFSPIRELPNFAVGMDAGYTFTNNDSWRRMGAGKASGSFDQDLFTVGLELEYAVNFACNGYLTPFITARYSHVEQDGFTETGVMSARIEDFDGDQFHTKLGAALGYDFHTGFGAVTPSLSVAWRHEFGDREYSTNAAYNIANPTNFTQRSVRYDRDSADIGASIRAAMDIGNCRKLGLNVGYNLNIGSNQKNHSLYAGFDLGF